jgi:regulatory protein
MAKTVSQKERKMSEENTFKTALTNAMALCAKREYCSSDIRKKLESWNLGSQEIDKAISLLIEDNYINDQRFTKAFVRDKINNNRWGKIKIADHLKTKNISAELIGSVLDSLDDDQYRKMIKNIIVSHRKYIKARNQFDLKGKLLRFGLSRGYESSILYDLLNQLY